MGGGASTLSNPNSDLSKIYSNITNSTSNLAKQSDLTNLSKVSDLSNLSRQSDLTNLARQSDLTNLARQSDLTNLARQSDLTNLSKISDLTNLSKVSDLSNLAKQSDLTNLSKVSDLTNLAKQSDLTDLAKQGDVKNSLTTITGISDTNITCPIGYNYTTTFNLGTKNNSNPKNFNGPFCIRKPQSIYNIQNPGTSSQVINTTAINVTCPLGDLVYRDDNNPYCVIKLADYQASACPYGVAYTSTRADANGVSYPTVTCNSGNPIVLRSA